MYSRWGSNSKRRSLPSPRESLSGGGGNTKTLQNYDGGWDIAGVGWGRLGERREKKKMAFWSAAS
jgi:hypothetical protein